MHKTLVRVALVAALVSPLAVLLPTSAFAASVISNGSFELGNDPGSYTTLTAPDTADITNWSVDTGSIDYIGTYWQAADGSRSIDLNGLAQGSISQTFATTPGTAYQVSFELSGNPDTSSDPTLTSPSLKDVQVSATGGSPKDFTFDTSVMNNTEANMMWQPETYSFTATGASTVLSFASQIAGAFGPVIDNVAVTPVAPVTPTCTPTGFFRDATNMTAAVIDPSSPVTGTVNATGCNIGVYFGPGTTGSVANANISGANYYGVVVQQATVNVSTSTINQIGDTPFDGDQHGVGIYYANVAGATNDDCTGTGSTSGTVNGNTITNYQKNGISLWCANTDVNVTGNTVTGEGPVTYIAQNGIEFVEGATGSVIDNNVSGNEYNGTGSTPACGGNPPGGSDPICDTQSGGILLYEAGSGISVTGDNQVSDNDMGLYNLLTSAGTTTVSGNTFTSNRYEGIAYDQGNAAIANNTITGGNIGIAGLMFSSDTANAYALVTGNTVTGASDSAIKLLADSPSDTFAPLINAHNNDLSGATNYGVDNTVTPIADATCNWWGNASGPGPVGPGSGDDVTNNVNFATWLTSSDLTGACNGGVAPSTVTVTIDKFIDGKAATTTSATATFQMQSSWNAANIGGAGSGTYTLGTSDSYDAVTSPMNAGSSYATNEIADGTVVGATCGNGAQYALAGYTTGPTFAAAAAGTPSATAPNFSSLASNENVIVWNTTCAVVPTFKVHILKYLNGATSTAATASNYLFPMQSSWNAANIGGAGSGTYNLGNNFGGASNLYGADTAAMSAPADYSTSEVTNDINATSKVLPVGATCVAGDYRLDGYQTSAISFADAATQTPSATAPSFSQVSVDQYVIVDNETCPTTASLTITKASIGGNGTFNFTSNIPGESTFSITTTNHSGSITFNGIAPGPYTVTEVNIPKGWTQTDNSCTAAALTLAAGDNVNCVITDTNNKLLGSIRGTKYEDLDGDGTLKDGDHHRIAGVTITITGPAGYSSSAVTDSHGLYDFTGLSAGTYKVCEAVPTGWIETMPSSGGCYTVNLTAGQNVNNKNFGDFKLGSISGTKFNDLNGNGREDKNEPGISGITINLKGPHGFSATTVTGANGNYSFGNLGPGVYTLSEVIPHGWNQTLHPWPVWILSGTNAKNDNFGNTQRSKNKWGGFWGN